jgi:hypothetical protein
MGVPGVGGLPHHRGRTARRHGMARRFLPGLRNERRDRFARDRHPLASVGTLVLGLRCSRCPGGRQLTVRWQL